MIQRSLQISMVTAAGLGRHTARPVEAEASSEERKARKSFLGLGQWGSNAFWKSAHAYTTLVESSHTQNKGQAKAKRVLGAWIL